MKNDKRFTQVAKGKIMKTKLPLLAGALMLSASMLPAYAEDSGSNVMFIFDSSGSMKKPVGNGESRADAAKRAMVSALSEMPEGTNLGLLMYGHRKAKDCSDIEIVAPIGTTDGMGISNSILASQPKGETPIAAALERAASSFTPMAGQSNSIVLVTDGIEECGGDPCAAARAIHEAGLDLKVHVVGFTLSDKQRQTVQCVADETGGKYFDAQDANGLSGALAEVQKVVVEEAPPALRDDDILSARNGGTLVYSPNKIWEMLNRDHEKFFDREGHGATYTGEAVWSFKGGKPATFSRIEVLVLQRDQYNLKDFEVLAADSVEGPFKSLGAFTVLNVKMQPEGWQSFEFPETTAKFVKVVFKTDQGGGHIGGNPLRLAGKIDDSAAVLEKPPSTDSFDILSAANGGTLAYSPNEVWEKLNKDHKEFFDREGHAATYDGEAVWSFKDGKLTTFSRIEVLVPHRDQYNLKDFEVLAADQLAGPYRSLGTFTVQNVKMEPEGWQGFEFPETSAKFVKVVFKTDQGGGHIGGNPLRLIGKPAETDGG